MAPRRSDGDDMGKNRAIAETDTRVGSRLVASRYRLTGVSGRGAAGMVWQAVDESAWCTGTSSRATSWCFPVTR
jgi:hypothetical protein